MPFMLKIVVSLIHDFVYRIAVTVSEDELDNLVHILESYTQEKIYELRQQVNFIWENYFRSPKVIAMTTLQIINDRVFPFAGRTYEEWNEIPNTVQY